MIKVGLTGSIGMGKSATLDMFADEGYPVFDADKTVHSLYAEGGEAVPLVQELFPKSIVSGSVDRQILAREVLRDPIALRRLEAVVHPLVADIQKTFISEAQQSGAAMVVLDIPLLFEGRSSQWVDVSVVVSAPYDLQRKRVLERPGMTVEKFESILAKQVPDMEKRARADYVIETGDGFDKARASVKKVISAILSLSP